MPVRSVVEHDADEATRWTPPAGVMSPDQDERPFREVLRDWGRAMGYTRAQQATALGVSMSGLNKWHDGAATPGTERTLRILMTLLIERAGAELRQARHP